MRRPRVSACEEHEAVLSALHSLVQFASEWVIVFPLHFLSVLYPIFFHVIDCIAPNVSLLHNTHPGVGHKVSARVDVLKFSHIVMLKIYADIYIADTFLSSAYRPRCELH